MSTTPVPIPDWAMIAASEAGGIGEHGVQRTAQIIADHWHRATQQTTCAFCGQAYPPGTPDTQHDLLTAHIRVCAKHPMREVEAEVKRLRKALFPFATYAEKRDAKPFSGLDDTIHAIHTGTKWAAEITLTDCRRAAKALRS